MDAVRRQDGEAEVEAFLAGERADVARIEQVVRRALGGFRTVFAHELDDLVQEVLLELTLALRAGRYDGRGVLDAYITRLARFHAIDRWRKRRLRTLIDIADLDLPSNDASPAHATHARDRIREVLRLFASMPEACQELWRMIVRGWSYRKMSETIGVSEGALRVRVLRCRQKALKARADEASRHV